MTARGTLTIRALACLAPPVVGRWWQDPRENEPDEWQEYSPHDGSKDRLLVYPTTDDATIRRWIWEAEKDIAGQLADAWEWFKH